MSTRDPDQETDILKRMQAAGHAAPQIILRTLSDDEPETEELGADRRSRYVNLGLIARGGVGEVLKSRDSDLGRAVAMKVLREKHAKDPEMVRRFVEEAQISGQLQHPGIVPVYELGADDDGRPWFAMKLVRGESLAARLMKRSDPSEQRRRYVAIFERVCQTVAYAHSRGVIHRDLKPSNVMLGTFGEIQVVDWGFAIVLGQGGIVDERRARLWDVDISNTPLVRPEAAGPGSMYGTVMGTPPYMSPEQALGHVNDLDERSDVFSLGAILTEILTGSPAYVGEPADVLVMAAEARLDDAHARLDACGADPELTDLARHCLAPLRADRPESAKEVADSISAYLAGVVARAHESKIAAIQARTQAQRSRARADRSAAEAEEQRTRRRHVFTLAGIALAVILAGGAIHHYIAADRAARARSAAAAIAREERLAHLKEGRGEWDSALESARSALALAESGEKKDRERVTALLARIEDGRKSAERRAARVARDDALLQTVEEILPQFGYETDGSQQAAAYASALESYGLDVQRMDPDPVFLAFVGSHRMAEIAAIFDRWAMLGRPRWQNVANIARKLDPDPWRDRIWEALIDEDPRAFRTMANSAEVARQSAQVEALLGMALLATNQSREAIEHLSAALVRHPANLEIVLLLARSFELRLPPFRNQVRRYLIAALALRPESIEIRRVLAHATRASGADDTALWMDALRIRPDWSLGLVHLSRARIETCDFAKAIEAGRRAVALDPKSTEAVLTLAEAELLGGEPLRASDRCRALDGASGEVAARAGLLLGRARLLLGRFDKARAAMTSAVAAAPESAAGREAKDRLDRFEEEVRIYGQWREVFSGKAEAADGAEALAFARTCLAERRYAPAAAYYLAAFKGDPALEAEHRVEAAKAAAATGRSLGSAADLTPGERSVWRTRARVWAEDYFEGIRAQFAARPDLELAMAVYRFIASRELNPLLYDGKRSVEEMAAFEQLAWKQFAGQVGQLLRAARLR